MFTEKRDEELDAILLPAIINSYTYKLKKFLNLVEEEIVYGNKDTPLLTQQDITKKLTEIENKQKGLEIIEPKVKSLKNDSFEDFEFKQTRMDCVKDFKLELLEAKDMLFSYARLYKMPINNETKNIPKKLPDNRR